MKKTFRFIIVGVIIILLLFLTVLLLPVSGKEKVFNGKVIDADTKEPIEGAVVVAYWYSERPGISGEDAHLKDVKENLTDKDGNWSITGEEGSDGPIVPYPVLVGVAGLRYTKKPEFIVFKPGYCPLPEGFSLNACKVKMKFWGSGEIMAGKTIELPRLTNKEDRLRVLPSSISSSSDDPREEKKIKKKQMEFLRLINEERRNLGLSEFKQYEELKNEK